MKNFILILLTTQSLLFASFSGVIVDKQTQKPIYKAMIDGHRVTVHSDKKGNFKTTTDEKKYHIKAYGYRPYTVDVKKAKKTIQLEPITVKALYLTFWGANIHSKTAKKMLKIIQETEVNAVVVDVKNEYGLTSYKTSVQEADNYNAHKEKTIGDMKNFMRVMKSKNIYTIARVAVFKDHLQATHNPEYAIKNRHGDTWSNHDNMAWIDPYDKRSHTYTINIAKDAAKMGFDEINFDYIRFPAKRGLVFSKPNTQKNRVQAIEGFLKSAKKSLKPYGVFISVDTYGVASWAYDDSGIGQKISSMSKYSDYIAPMLYPSGFAKGTFGFGYPADYPYFVIYKTLKNMNKKIQPIRVRPWLQYFKDYAHSKRTYLKYEVNRQIQATKDIKTSGWMMWSPSSRYHKEYFKNTD